METVNSQISVSHQPTDTKNSIGPCRNGPPRGRRRPRKSRPGHRLDLSQPKAPLKPRKLQKGQNTDAPTKRSSVSEFSIDGLYPNDDVIYPAPPNFSHCQTSAQKLPADIVSPRARDGNHNRLSSIREDQSSCALQEDKKRENPKRTPHVLLDEWEHKIHSKGPPQERNIRDRPATKTVSYNNEQVHRPLFQASILPTSQPMSRDPSTSTHDAVEQNTDEVEIPKAETVSKVSEISPQVVEPVSDMRGDCIGVGIEGGPHGELPVPRQSKYRLIRLLSQVIPKTRPPTHNTKLNESSGGAPISWASEPIGGPWIDQEHQMFLNFEMWP